MRSVIVPTWNAGALIDTCLASIDKQLTAGDELIVIDNGSRDGTPDRVATRYPQVKLVRLPENLGFAGGVNRGLELARGDDLILINQDVVLRPNCLAALSALLAAGPTIVGCKLLYPDGITIQHAGGIINWPRAMPDHFGYRQVDDGRWDSVKDVDYVTGAVFGFNRAVFDTLGLLDEGFFPAYYEEVDYCYRARAMGARVVYEPAAVAIHHETQSMDRHGASYQRAMECGRLRFVLKNTPPAQLLNDFFPAELEAARHVTAAVAHEVCGPAYADVLTNLPPLPPDHAVAITLALRQLRAAARRTAATREVSMPESLAPLEVSALREHEFQSSLPVVGAIIVKVRRALYALTAKWPLRVALDQQTRINQQLVQRLREHETLLRQYEIRLHEYEERLIDQDRDLAHLSRIAAENELQYRQAIQARRSEPGTPQV